MTWPPSPNAPVDPQVRAFLDDIADHPEDAAVRLVFADWLEERGDPRAEWLRMQASYIRDKASGARQDGIRKWLRTYGKEWLGTHEKPPGHWLRFIQNDRLTVGDRTRDEVTAFLEAPTWEPLRLALREGWVRHFKLKAWHHHQITRAAELGLLSGPSELTWEDCLFGDETFTCLAAQTQLRSLWVGGVHEIHSHVSDTGLAHLSRLVRLRDLSLPGKVLGPWPASLSRLKALRRLSLACCEHVGDGALSQLGAFSQLEELCLAFCEITNRDLSRLPRYAALRSLSLSGNDRLSYAGIRHLTRLPGLTELELVGCRGISEAGFARLAALDQLERLDLGGSHINDAGLAHLSTLARLERLGLSDCELLTGSSFDHLHTLKSLKSLELCRCKLKPHKLRALRQALPNCKVIRRW